MKIDRVHFYVEDARASCDWFVRYLGFQRVSGHLTSFHTRTEIVQSGSVYFWLSSPLSTLSPVAEFLRQHPPGVADVAFVIEDVAAVMARAQAHDVTILQPIQEYQQNGEYVKSGKIAAWGGLTHTLIEKSGGVDEWGSGGVGDSPFCTAIDHLVLNVATGDLKQAVAWYGNILDFQPQQAFKIQSDRSALFSQVLISPDGNVQLPINEPASANSQIQEFLNLNRGAGIQHIALHTTNIVQAIAKFRACGLALLPVPQSYYTQLKTKLTLPLLPEEFEAIAQQEILIDWKDTPDPQRVTPLLLQIFTQPIFGQPTFFLELIERRSQAQGFGEGNFRALFEAIESEQIKRGSLN